ncbi:unnamed protein product [Bursaphelenchus okinawaensis]|uniref:receptor protein serine/threonine kinase n=1 Tax=Bursaphelenchus okinawaensis TaxID=465554 RepID=A0A811KI50_9BILA|nr:unnamed protein product [Bursaphelenchus okinawaensis]CAG9102871.1 unnamed protein product [Bursaphelenchus okinawaensis]
MEAGVMKLLICVLLLWVGPCFGNHEQQDHLYGVNYESFLTQINSSKRVPHYIDAHGKEGTNFNLDENGMPYIICESLNNTCNGTEEECTQPIRCYQERRSHRLGCMAVFVYNTTELSKMPENKRIPPEAAMLKGCWTQDESELRECEEHSECVANTRKTGTYGRAAKFCCCRTHHCNRNLTFYSDVVPKNIIVSDPRFVFFDNVHWLSRFLLSTDFFAVAALLILVILFLFGLCFAVWLYRKRQRRKTNITLKPYDCEDDYSHGIGEITDEGTQLLKEAKGASLKEILLSNEHMMQHISSGHFSDVHSMNIAEATGNRIIAKVAVKRYNASDLDCWINEQEIYAIKALRQKPEIVAFICAFRHDDKYWFVTKYYENGSVYDYLKEKKLDVVNASKLLVTMLSGLAFLHEEFFFEGEVKPTIVHRDIKSKNVLVDSDHTALIGDFSLSIKCENGRMGTEENQSQVGTRRYMSPEVLEGATEFTGFAFQQIDVYAAALVIWEVMSRTLLPDCVDDSVPEYMLPYQQEAGEAPTLGKMREIVVMGRSRPKSRPALFENPITGQIMKTMQDMWDSEPDGRITSSCARDRLVHVYQMSSGVVVEQVYKSSEQYQSGTSLNGTSRACSTSGAASETGATIPIGQLQAEYNELQSSTNTSMTDFEIARCP